MSNTKLGPLLTLENLENVQHNEPAEPVVIHHSKARQIDRHCHEILKALSQLDDLDSVGRQIVKEEISDRLKDIRTYVATARWTDWRHGGYDTTS